MIFVAIYNCVLTVKLFNSNDYTGGLARELSWMYGELAGCVVCASASSLKPFFVRYIPSLISSHFLSNGDSASAGNQLSREGKAGRMRQDAYELDSLHGASAEKKGQSDDDEAQLWAGPINAASVSAGGVVSGHDSGIACLSKFGSPSKPSIHAGQSVCNAGQSVWKPGISVVSTTSVDYT